MKIGAINHFNNVSKNNSFKGVYAVRGTNEEVGDFVNHFCENMKQKGHRGKYRMYFYGPRISPNQPQCDLLITTGKDMDTLSEFTLEESERNFKKDPKKREEIPEDPKSEDFIYWYFKQTDSTLKKLREKFGSPIQVKSASSILRAIAKDSFDFIEGEIKR